MIAADGEGPTGGVDVSVSMTAEEQADSMTINRRRTISLFITRPFFMMGAGPSGLSPVNNGWKIEGTSINCQRIMGAD